MRLCIESKRVASRSNPVHPLIKWLCRFLSRKQIFGTKPTDTDILLLAITLMHYRYCRITLYVLSVNEKRKKKKTKPNQFLQDGNYVRCQQNRTAYTLCIRDARHLSLYLSIQTTLFFSFSLCIILTWFIVYFTYSNKCNQSNRTYKWHPSIWHL